MAELNPAGPVRLQALLLADFIYQDRSSGKYVISGTFHQMNIANFPTTFARSFGVFIALSGLSRMNHVELEFVDAASDEVLLQMRALDITWNEPALPVEFAVEVPPLSLDHAGDYYFQLKVNGNVLGKAPLLVRAPGNVG